MRDHGQGTIQEYKTKGGTRYKVCLPRSLTGGARRWRTFATRQEAERELSLAIAAVHSGAAAAPGDLTLGEFGLRWLERCSHRSADDDRGRWRRFVLPRPIADLALDEITPTHVKRCIESVAQTRKMLPAAGERFAHEASRELVSAQTVRHVYGLLRRCLKEAVMEGHIDRNPCAEYSPPDAERDRSRQQRDFLTAAEIEQVLTCAAIPLRYRLIYEVAIFTGLRAGELWGLRWEDVRELGTEQPVCICRRSYAGSTKSRRTRQFVLLPRAAAALRRWRDLAKHKRPADLIFPGRCGAMHADTYDAEWGGKGKNREKAGLREELVFHSFRHTFASHLIMGTWGVAWRIEEVRAYIDHSSIAVTQQYAHLSKSHLADLTSRTIG